MYDFDNPITSMSLEIITAAASGDSIAMTKILQHYQKYIVNLSLRNRYDNGVTNSVYIDEFLRRSLENKLIEKVLSFDVSICR
ncbi:MAG: helix-turn-helix domain-containing protein [Enterococcus gallinarum]|nr:helix-turn-helix domain-containing protein [Enterococcus gallinarum]MDU4931965.1 helix-turn-helix domain-containing protein [Enterococcus gallinarum]